MIVSWLPFVLDKLAFQGDYENSTLLDFGKDAAAAVRFLANECDDLPQQAPIGIIGHSEGGLTGPIATLQEKESVSFLVLMAALAMTGKEVQAGQPLDEVDVLNVTPEFMAFTKDVLDNSIYDAMIAGGSKEDVKRRIHSVVRQFQEDIQLHENLSEASKSFFTTDRIDFYTEHFARRDSYAYREYLQYDPVPNLKLLASEHDRPVLAINGEKDVLSPPANLNIISEIFKDCGNKSYTAKSFPGKNHLFQQCETGTHLEYGELEESFSTDVSSFVANWIRKVTTE